MEAVSQRVRKTHSHGVRASLGTSAAAVAAEQPHVFRLERLGGAAAAMGIGWVAARDSRRGMANRFHFAATTRDIARFGASRCIRTADAREGRRVAARGLVPAPWL